MHCSLIGPTGRQGIQGFQGLPGVPGPTGAIGIPGQSIPGPTGTQGLSGLSMLYTQYTSVTEQVQVDSTLRTLHSNSLRSGGSSVIYDSYLISSPNIPSFELTYSVVNVADNSVITSQTVLVTGDKCNSNVFFVINSGVSPITVNITVSSSSSILLTFSGNTLTEFLGPPAYP